MYLCLLPGGIWLRSTPQLPVFRIPREWGWCTCVYSPAVFGWGLLCNAPFSEYLRSEDDVLVFTPRRYLAEVYSATPRFPNTSGVRMMYLCLLPGGIWLRYTLQLPVLRIPQEWGWCTCVYSPAVFGWGLLCNAPFSEYLGSEDDVLVFTPRRYLAEVYSATPRSRSRRGLMASCAMRTLDLCPEVPYQRIATREVGCNNSYCWRILGHSFVHIDSTQVDVR